MIYIIFSRLFIHLIAYAVLHISLNDNMLCSFLATYTDLYILCLKF